MTPGAVHRQTAERVRSAMVAAMRADPDRLNAGLLSCGGLDRPETDFVREARVLVLALAAALTTVLRGRGPYGDDLCLGCGIPDCRTVRAVGEALAAYQVSPVQLDRTEARIRSRE
ncbi:hypothetical protein [Actinomadura gamaensis]|uniref:Uncharacterized protein n=1 Tax=Actinomadura gamaensis TaxID=1763541 RepID=A0ABV9TU32_9ACTN